MMSQDDFDTAPNEFVDALDHPVTGEKHDLKKGDGIFHHLKFYIAQDENKQELTELIQKNGGEVLSELPTADGTKSLVVSPFNTTNLPTVTPKYIKTCCENNVLMKLQNYMVPFDDFRAVIDTQLQHEDKEKTGDVDGKKVDDEEQVSSDPGANGHLPSAYDVTRAMLARTNMPQHNKASFTEEEDEFILDVVRKNPTRRTTHTLFDEISHYIPNHTGNSIRHRYRVYLAKKLSYVYQVDSNGKLVRDDNGDLIKTTVLPQSLKRKFTADEDYTLALELKKQFYRDIFQMDPDTRKSLIAEDDGPNTVARRNMTMDPNLVPGQEPLFQNFKVGDRRGPIAREFFKTFAQENPTHTENAWRDRFRKFLLTYGIDSYIDYYQQEKAMGREPQPMKNLTNRPKRPGVPTPGNYSANTKKARVVTSTQPGPSAQEAAAAAQFSIPEGELLDEETLNFLSGLRRDLSRIESSNGMAFEYPQEIAESIRNDFTNEESQFDNIDPDDIPFPPQVASTELFMPHFFHMNSTRSFLDKVNEVISRDYEPSQAEKLVQDLCDEAGVRKTFSTSILTALSGDLMVFPRYFLCMFRYSANPPMNVPGIWTREDDELLRSNNEEDINSLTRKHGVGRIEMRRRFIASDLV